MGTSLKGMGVFRKELLIQIIEKFGRKSFTYREVSTIPGFSRAVFMNLYTDGLLKKTSKGLPLQYSIASTPIRSRKEQNSPPLKVGSDITFHAISERGGGVM